MIVTAQQLIEGPLNKRHAVLLGAGASRASFPEGDASGRRLPVMDDFMEILELQPLIVKAGLEIGRESNFEVLYGRLCSDTKYANAAEAIERRTRQYFSRLSLPSGATIYDRILLSLRPIDAVFTFNWDPFLFDAYLRNRDAVPLPKIFFLHGNVRIGACVNDDKWGAKNGRCPDCLGVFAEVPLLYPIGQKNYSDHPYIRRNWEAARTMFGEAFTLTIFGYGAPVSDKDAVELLRQAWTTDKSPRTFEHIEIIDTAPQSLLSDRWSPFTPTHHHHFTAAFEQSRIARWPRRSCESTFYPMTQGVPCQDFPFPNTDSLTDLQRCAAAIARHEGQ